MSTNNRKTPRSVYIGVSLYIIAIIIIVIPMDTSVFYQGLIKFISMLVFFYVLLFLPLFFKFINLSMLWVIFSVSIGTASSVNGIDQFGFGGLLVVLMLLSVILNLLLIVRGLYSKRISNLEPFPKFMSRVILYKDFIMFCVIGLKVWFVLYAFDRIYTILYGIDNTVFKVVEGGNFSGIYLSFVTFFTIGFGDITPVHPVARMYSMIQMLVGYVLTVIIIPVLYIALSNKNKDTDLDLE